MIDLKALQKQVGRLEADLKPTGLEDPRLKVEWRAAKAADRTAATFEMWLGDRVTQVAVAWVLASAFVRFCEDNGLIEYPFITGPEERSALARDLQDEFYKKHPESDDRGWLEAAFTAISVSPVAAGLFDKRHNPMWTILPSPHAVKGLLDFWRQTGPDGEILYDFTDPEWNTRFLGDMYQDLSEAARKTYALLQTPEFVEEFILKYTLDPAIEEFGLEPDPPQGHDDLPRRLRLIDPACGSGHFLLGAFRRLLEAWQAEPGDTDQWILVARALESVHGVDKNPFAVAIARFRLLLAAMKAAGVTRLTERVDFPLNIAVGDSLLHGKGAPGRQAEFNLDGDPGAHTYRTEDVDDYIKSVHILEVGTYHVVVGNPPYVSVSDKKEVENYRKAYPSCHKEISLAVPFAERFFRLAIIDPIRRYHAGYVGQITANSFMKREFGQKLAQDFLPRIDLTHVIDTSGAYIPGHGTPTVILIGRRRDPRSPVVRAVRSVKGEPGIPIESANGFVWTQIVSEVNHPGFKGEWITVDDLDRVRYFIRHPWILESGGLELIERIGGASVGLLSSSICRIGYYGDSHADQAFIFPAIRRFKDQLEEFFAVGFHRGQQIRDWREETAEIALLPYDKEKAPLPDFRLSKIFVRLLWPFRTELWNRVDFSGQSYRAARRLWWEWHQLPRDAGGHDWVIAYSDLSTHNHFVLNTANDVYNRHAPIVRLKESASSDDYFGLLATLNSSIVCFFLQQVCYNRGEGGGARVQAGYSAMGSEGWKNNYDFTAAQLERIPLPQALPVQFGRNLNVLAQQMASTEPSSMLASGAATRERLKESREKAELIRSRMLSLQEELDWDLYCRYELIAHNEAAELIARPGSVPDLKLGERAFEILLARRVEKGELDTEWFARFGGKQTTEIPEDWPDDYRRVVGKRIELIERNRDIGLIERPECKRRWQTEPWESKEQAALTTWLLDRCEERSLWYDGGSPRPMTVNRLADRLRADADVVSVARLLKGPDADLADVLREIIDTEHVPFVAQYRYKPSGLEKRRQWERTWGLQREEDATGKRPDIPVPPKYVSADFQKNSYWRHRGKLDVPKERFISYPDASPDSDAKSLLIGWAGWDYREQAAALIILIEDRSSVDGWDTDRLKGLLAGLLEVMPWVRQWHGEIAQAFGQSYADAYDGYLTAQRESRSLTEDDLRTWPPPQPTHRRRTC